MVFIDSIPNLDHTITKPIVMQVLRQIREDNYFKNKTPIYYLDYTGSTVEIGSNLSEKNNNDLLIENSSKIIATSRETQSMERSLTTMLFNNEILPIWVDKSLGMDIGFTRVKTDVIIDLRYKGTTKAEVNDWINHYYRRLCSGVTFSHMSLAYEVTVPETSINIIEVVYKAREKKAPYNDGFLNYLNSGFLRPTEIKTNMVGKGASLVVLEKLTHVVVGVQPEVPEITRLDSGNYEASIELKFVYSKPTISSHKYPAFVHNSYINRKYINLELDRNAHLEKVNYGVSDYFAHLFRQKSNSWLIGKEGYVFPKFDDTVLKSNQHIENFLQVQLQVSEDDLRLITDLKLLETETNTRLNELFIPFIREYRREVLFYGRSMINISIYKGGKLLNPEEYYIDDNMHLRAYYDLDLRGSYHLTIGILKRVSILSEKGLVDLAKYGKVALGILAYMVPNLPKDEIPKLVVSNNPLVYDRVNADELGDALRYIEYMKGGGSNYRFVNSIIVAV